MVGKAMGNDKKFSFDNDATTQSNSSTHEHEDENKNFVINMNYMCKNNSNNKITKKRADFAKTYNLDISALIRDMNAMDVLG